MAGELQPTPGVSSRRSACDRCRGQKLRCLREQVDIEGRCDRCAKADARCITSPIYHLRNVFFTQDPAVLSGSTPKPKRRRWEREDDASARQAPASAPALPSPALLIPSPAIPSPSPYSGYAAPATSVARAPVSKSTSTSTSTSNSTSTSTTFDWSAVDPFARPTSTRTSTSNGARSSSISTSFTPPNWNWLVDPVASESPTASAGLNTWDAGDLTLEHLFSPDNLHNNDKPLTSFDKAVVDCEGNTPSPFGGGPQPWSRTQSQGIPSLAYGEHGSELSPPGNLGSLDLDTQNNDPSDETHNYMEELSKINLDLVTQLRRIELPHVNLETLIEPACRKAGSSATTPLEDILNSTHFYLNVLSLIAGSCSLFLTSNTLKLSRSYSGYTSVNTSVSCDDSSQSSYSSLASMQPSSNGVSRTQLDSATQLQVLICYVHVLRLNVALFAHMGEYLQIISESNERTISPLPRFCGFSNIPLGTPSISQSHKLIRPY